MVPLAVLSGLNSVVDLLPMSVCENHMSLKLRVVFGWGSEYGVGTGDKAYKRDKPIRLIYSNHSNAQIFTDLSLTIE